jgi:cAMP-dependent protein kinase regulator
VLHEGEPGHEAFVVVRGVINVVRQAGPTLLAVLGPGAIFGEMALVSDAPRVASAVAVEPVEVLTISRQALERLGQEDPGIGQELGAFCYGRMVSNLMRHSPILSCIELAKRRELVGRFTNEHFAAGAFLVHQGKASGRLLLIASGRVEVRSTDPEGERLVLAELGPGEVVGEISLVLRRAANADVVALYPTVALALSNQRFQESIREHPMLLRQLYDIAIQRSEETENVFSRPAVDASDIVLL